MKSKEARAKKRSVSAILMKIKVLYVERKFDEFFSLEKVFRQVARSLSDKIFDASFEQVKYLSGAIGMLKNLSTYKPKPADVYHVTGHITYISLVLPREKTILTVPDLVILQFRTGVRRFVLKKILFDLPVRKSKYITAISQATKDEIVKQTGCDAKKIRVVEVPLDENFTIGEKKDFNAACPRILQIGAAPHKNIPNVAKALEGINCRLVIIGRLDAATVSLLKEKNINYENEFGLDDEAVKQHYRAADLAVFCSLSEGFGLPIIEAQAMKTPVVTSDVNPMKEVAGRGALLVNPNDYLEIREAIKKIIGDAALRENLIADGIENIKRFHPAVVAEKYANLYREIYQENNV